MAAEAEAAREARAKVSIHANKVTFLFLVKTLVCLCKCREQWPLKQRQSGMRELRLHFCKTSSPCFSKFYGCADWEGGELRIKIKHFDTSLGNLYHYSILIRIFSYESDCQSSIYIINKYM